MNKLRADIQRILIEKCERLRTIDAGTVDWCTLDMEINDAQHILIQIDSKSPHSHKLSAIEAIQKQTTSGSIYETVNAYLENEKEEKKYYFVTIFYGGSVRNIANGVIEEHPMDWQIRVNELYPSQYVLTDWKEITKEEYNKYPGQVEVK
jgi:hypothetical protein